MNSAAQRNPRWPQFLVWTIIVVYCAIFLVNPPGFVPDALQKMIREAQSLVSGAIGRGLSSLAGVRSPRELATAIYFLLIAGLIPALAARLAGRTLYDLGWRWPNKLAVRYFIVALVVSAPFLIWMVKSPTIATPYLKQLHRMGFTAFAGFYLVNMFTEHLLLHGIVLGLARPDGRWPQPAPAPAGSGRLGVFGWLGMAMPHERDSGSRWSAWLGLAPGCLLPMFFSALLFGLVHLGKDSRELVLAFPGGLAQAYIAYRSNSWFTPFLIHLATASAALAMMAWMT